MFCHIAHIVMGAHVTQSLVGFIPWSKPMLNQCIKVNAWYQQSTLMMISKLNLHVDIQIVRSVRYMMFDGYLKVRVSLFI